MNYSSSEPVKNENQKKTRKPYEAPAIIYKGKLNTRAGSPPPVGPLNDNTIADPADLFGND
jgi:hypothetical protein